MARKRQNRAATGSAAALAPAREKRSSFVWGGLLLAVVAAFQVYSPVVNAPFVFDDDYLPFTAPNFPQGLSHWISGVRPLLMFSYWVNFQIWGQSTTGYHIVNILIHTASALLAFLVLRRLLVMAGVERSRQNLFAGFGAAVFLLHPLQTESVAYVASRSESLSGMLVLAALAVFLLRPEGAISWPRAAAVLLLFAAAGATKEHTLVLPVVLIVSDYYWSAGFRWVPLRRNWRLYLPILALGAAGGVLVARLVISSSTTGFHLRGMTWYQYFFTECRAIFVYLRLFVLPVGQTVDYDFPISHTPLEHGAIIGLAVLSAAVVAAVMWRRKYPLASYGFLLFLILLAPTSSFVPIQDPVAERRMYLPVLGLVLVVIEFLRRVRLDTGKLGAVFGVVAVLLGVSTFFRNQVWAGPVALWEDTVRKSPAKPRPHFQLGYAYYQENRCQDAVAQYQAAARLQGPAYDLLVDWALAYDCLNQPVAALEKLRQAAALERTAHVYTMIGVEYARQSLWPEALDALATAEQIDPNYAMLYFNRGGVREKLNDLPAAAADYRKAVALDPGNRTARQALVRVESRMRTVR